MKDSVVKTKLKTGEEVLAVKVAYRDPALVEMVALMGFDCVWICNEHIGINFDTLEHLIRAARLGGMDAMVRLARGRHTDILQLLEAGARGLMIPKVTDPAYVRQIISDAKFKPLGNRGADGVNVDADFGLIPFKEYIATANDNNFIMVQIEESSIVDSIDEIAAIEGVDILFLGPGDMALSMGIPGQTDHPRIHKVLEKIVKACQKHGKTAGAVARNGEDVKRLRNRGVRFFASGGDWSFCHNGFLSMRNEMETAGLKFRPLPDINKDRKA